MFRATIAVLFVAFVSTSAARAQQGQPPPPDDTKTRELPDGEGRNILRRACTTCHDLDEVTKFSPYFTRDDWRDVVGTMVKYGAELRDGETEVLVEYLGRHVSKQDGK